MPEKPKLAMYWASSCGGCEISVVNLHEKILELDSHFDFFFCPCLLDTKISAVRDLPAGGLALTLFNGAIRTEENEAMAKLLRAKSKVLIAFGACSSSGSIPALSNLHSRKDHLRTIYLEGPTLDNAAGVIPRERTEALEGVLELPTFFSTVKTLAQTVDVDYSIPGCPPEPHQIWRVIEAVIQGLPLPRGAVFWAEETRRSARSVPAPGSRSRSPIFTASMRSIPTARAACWNRGWCAWELRRGMDAGRSVRR